MSIKDFHKIVVKSKIFINVFCYENTLSYPILISDQKFKSSMDLLIISDKIQSHYVYIKDFYKLMFNKTKNKKKKNTFANIVSNVLAVKKLWENIKKLFKNKW